VDCGVPLVPQLLSKTKFKQIMRYLRFDEKSNRASKRDKFAMIRDLWDLFIRNTSLLSTKSISHYQ
jgi:hypothetical protein